MAETLKETLANIRASAAEFDNDGVEDGIGQLEWFIEDDGTWGDELFDTVKGSCATRRSSIPARSHRLVSTLQLEWEWLSPRQHEELRPLLAAAFDRYGDWLGSQLTAELFAERYADGAAYDTLERLSRTAAHAPARALAAYGIGRLARTLERGPVYDRAIAALSELSTSADHRRLRRSARGARVFREPPTRDTIHKIESAAQGALTNRYRP
jgi:hypothetical protein